MAGVQVDNNDETSTTPDDDSDLVTIGIACIENHSHRVIKKTDLWCTYGVSNTADLQEQESSHVRKGRKICLGRDLPPGLGIDIALCVPREHQNNLYHSWTVSLDVSPGDYLQWSHQDVSMYNDEGNFRWPCPDIPIEPDDVFAIIDEPLTEEDLDAVNSEVLQNLQSSTPFISNLWGQIAERVSSASAENGRPGRTGELLVMAWHDLDNEYDRRWDQEPPYWSHNVYQQHRKTLEQDITGKWLNQSYLNQCLRPGGRARIDAYWRAMNRRPGGGDADNHTICYTIDCGKQAVSTRTYKNYQDELIRSECCPPKLAQRISSWVANSSSNDLPPLLELLRSLGLGNSECTILDTLSRNREESDSTWTSQEILVSVPRLYTWETRHLFRSDKVFQELRRTFLLVSNRLNTGLLPETIHAIFEWAAPDAYVPVTRLHRGCVMGPQWRPYVSHGQNQLEERPPTHAQEVTLQAVEELVGMGRVNTWSDYDFTEPCEATLDYDEARKHATFEDSRTDLELPNDVQPFYFDFPAKFRTEG